MWETRSFMLQLLDIVLLFIRQVQAEFSRDVAG